MRHPTPFLQPAQPSPPKLDTWYSFRDRLFQGCENDRSTDGKVASHAKPQHASLCFENNNLFTYGISPSRLRFVLFQVSARRSAGQAVGDTSGAGASAGFAAAPAQHQHQQQQHRSRRGQHSISGSRPARYQNMAKFKTRLQYNSMGERVIVRTAVESIDAFAARSRQTSSSLRPQQEHESRDGNETRVPAIPQQVSPAPAAAAAISRHPGTTAGEGLSEADFRDWAGGGENSNRAVGAISDAVGAWTPRDGGNNAAPEKISSCTGDDGRESSAAWTPPRPQSVSKSLGFGWPDFSSIGSKVGTVVYV